MLSSFFRHTASAAALFLAAGGMHTPLLAATTAGHPATKWAASTQRPVWPLRKPEVKTTAKTAKTARRVPHTPFETIMLPHIKADLAKHAAEHTAHGVKPAVAHPLTASTSGGGASFGGFQAPPTFQTIPITNDHEVGLAVTADFNKDGKADLVTIQKDGSLNVILSASAAGASPQSAVSSINPSAVTFSLSADAIEAADLNADGYPDIEVMDLYNGNVYIWMNNGDGTFASVSQITPALPSGDVISATPYFQGDVLFADVTGDGRPDMVVISGSPVGPDTIQLSYSVFAGIGNGTFPSVPTATASAQLPSVVGMGAYHTLQAVDVNGDGKLDLVLPTAIEYNTGTLINPVYVGFNYTYVLTGNNLGSFSPPASVSPSDPLAFNVGSADSLSRSYFGPLSGTQSGLLVAGSNALYGQISNGDGTLQAAVSTVVPDNYDFYDAQFADVSGDGKPDAIFYVDGYIATYAGNGDGSFSTTVSSEYISGYTSGVTQPAPADFDGDGKVDIPEVGEYGDSAIYLGKGNGLFAGAPVVAPPVDEAYYDSLILSANLTGKGFSDVLLYDDNEDLDLLVGANDGHGNFTYTEALSADALNAINYQYVEPFSVDINGDGYADILIADNVGGIYYALNKADGSGTFATPVALNLGGTVACELYYGTTGDLNGDGKTDIVLAFDGCGSGDFTHTGIFSLINQGNGTFTPVFSPTNSEPYAVSLADIDNDGKLDAVVLDDGAAVAIVKGVGDGTFDSTHEVQVPVYSEDELYGLAVGDYDGDGKQDLVLFGNNNDHAVLLLKGNGDFTFQPGPAYIDGSYGAGGQLVDLNGDGALDLVFNYYADADSPYPSTGYLINTGKGGFGTPVILNSEYNDGYDEYGGDYGTPIVVADFNQDGAPDFASVSYYTSGIFYNMGGISLALTSSAPTATQDSSVTLTAALTPSLGTATASGTVTFYDNGTVIGVESVSGNSASLTLSTLPVGANAITAVYSGDANYNVVSSSTNVNMTSVSVTALPPTFTLATLSGSSLNLTVGQTGVATFMVTGNATFNGAITFACSGAPAASTCTVTPGSVTLTGAQSSTVSVVLATTDPNNHFSATNRMPTWLKTTGGITLAGGLLLLWPNRRRRNMWTLMLVSVIGLGAMTTLSGCSDHKYSGTPAGSYTMTVTATSGSVTQTGTIAVTVNK
jgi:hypothetical protein